ncbi:MAG: hypothetical protein HWN69_00495 [Desulfobacterales bacterium]|nr:hypothetical protein [Desulfobacterales bacterium]
MTIDQTMEEKLIDKIELENGLTLELYDCSRRVAGDRWLISLVARIEVDVTPEYFEDKEFEDFPFDEIKKTIGDTATYQHEKQRNFVSETKKDDVFKELKDRFLSVNLGYLSSPDFARKLILMKYQEAWGRRVSWKSQ